MIMIQTGKLSVPGKMEKSITSWIDITQNSEEAYRELKLGELLQWQAFWSFWNHICNWKDGSQDGHWYDWKPK